VNFCKATSIIFILIYTSFYPQTVHLKENSISYIHRNQTAALTIKIDESAFPKTFSQSFHVHQSYVGRSSNIPDSISSDYDRSFTRIGGEFLIGAISGFLIYVPVVVASATRNGIRDEAIPAIYAAYSFGAGLGVYLIAKGGNDSLSFWGTIGSSIIGGGLSLALPFLFKEYDSILITLFSFPVICAVIYANLIAPFPAIEKPIEKNRADKGEEFKLSDPVNMNMIVKFHLLKIYL
jgi:hypothetical protein